MYRGLILSILLLSCFYKGWCEFVAEPGHAYGLLNKPLYIPCVTSTTPNNVNWWRSPRTNIGNSQTGILPAYKDDYNLTACSSSCNNFTIRINSVRLGEPQLFCEALYIDGGLTTERSDVSAITVIAPPYSEPTCSLSPTSITTGGKLTLTCSSAGGVEPVTLKWIDGDSYLTHGPGVNGTELSGRGNRVLGYEHTVSRADNRKQFTCTANNTALAVTNRGALTCTTEKVNVIYKPDHVVVEPAGSHTVTEGESATLTITCSANPPADEFRFKLKNSWSSWGSTNTKTYAKLKRSDAGDYSCEAKNSVGTTTSPSASLVVLYPPDNVAVAPESHTVIEGDSAKLIVRCNVGDANPKAMDLRFKLKGKDSNNWSSWGSSDTQDYTGLTRSNAGEYSCQAKNSVGTTSSEPGSLSVNYKPKNVAVLPNSQAVREGESATLTITCSVGEADPEANKFRFKVKNENNNNWSSWSGSNQKTYMGLRRSNAGYYSCLAKNNVGTTTSTSGNLVIYYPPTVSEFTITGGSTPGEDVTITCSGDSQPLTSVQIRNGTNVLVAKTGQNTAEYKIDKVDCLDSGNFSCVVNNNEYDEPATAEERLDAHCPPRFFLTSPNPPKLAAEKGMQARPLLAEVIAYPHPDFSWQHVNRPDTKIPGPGFVVKLSAPSTLLTIQNITQEQFGNYTVTATNKHGNDSVMFLVTSQSKPDPPRNVKLKVTAVSLAVVWERGWNGGLEQMFHLEYSGESKTIQDNDQHYSVKLDGDDGIRASTEYTVSLYATNDKGSSPTVTKTAVTKAQPVVSEEDTTIKYDKSANQAVITWSVSNIESLTLIVVQVCEVNTKVCHNNSLTPKEIKQPTTLSIPEGGHFKFSFFIFDGIELVSKQEDAKSIGPPKTKSNHASIIGAVLGVTLVLVIIIGVIAFFIWRNRTTKGQDEDSSGTNVRDTQNNFIRQKLEIIRGLCKVKKAERPEAGIYDRTNPTYVNEHMCEPEYARLPTTSQQELVYEEVDQKSRECTPQAVKLGSLVRKGAFFEVFNGTVQNLSGIRQGSRLIVKLPKEGASVFEKSMLVNEIRTLKTIGNHSNVVKLLAQCIHNEPVMSLLELEENGNLRNYIKRVSHKMPVNVFLRMSSDVTNGMDYLVKKMNILHHCLSLDHVVLSRDMKCKILGFGLADDILEREEYERSQGVKEALPWMAPEQVQRHEHTHLSDVWSFGVLMWEMFSYGLEPYADMDNEQTKRSILSGGMLGCPASATDELFDVMQTCWQMNPNKRPSFASLKCTLSINEK